MASGEIQGELWGAKAADWVEAQEPHWRPVYEAVLSEGGVGAGTKLLDIGCGAGAALVIARGRGAEVAGLDAAKNLVAVARSRLPDARIEIGEMEELPFSDRAFDVVTGFNAFQFAADPVRALREAGRVCRAGGTVAMLVWGRREDCDLMRITVPAVMALMPPPPPGAPQPTALSEPGVIQRLMEEAGLAPGADGEIGLAFVYPDAATAIRAISSAGVMVKAVRTVGETAVTDALARALGPFTRADGTVVQENRFRWVLARPG